jgi:hypothetical protein
MKTFPTKKRAITLLIGLPVAVFVAYHAASGGIDAYTANKDAQRQEAMEATVVELFSVVEEFRELDDAGVFTSEEFAVVLADAVATLGPQHSVTEIQPDVYAFQRFSSEATILFDPASGAYSVRY